MYVAFLAVWLEISGRHLLCTTGNKQGNGGAISKKQIAEKMEIGHIL